jgi:hypothetical protein
MDLFETAGMIRGGAMAVLGVSNPPPDTVAFFDQDEGKPHAGLIT